MLPGKVTKALPLVGIAILVYLILRMGPASILDTLSKVDLFYLLPAALLYVLYLMIQNVKWEMLARKQGIRLGYFRALKIYFIGAFYGIITPGRIGNFIRISYLKRNTGKSTGEAGVSVVIDKIMDLLAPLSMAMIGVLALMNYLGPEFFVTISAAYAALVAMLAFFFRKGASRRILRIFWKLLIPRSMKERTRTSFNDFHESMLGVKDMVVPFVITVIGFMVLYASTFMIALSLGIDVPYLTFAMVFPIATLVGALPISVGGWGTREATLIMLFSFFGVEPRLVMVMSIVSATMSYVLTAALGGVSAVSEEGGSVKA